MSPTPTYRPRHPERTPFYQCLEDYWDEFKQSYPYFYEAQYGNLAPGSGEDRQPLLGVWPPASWLCPPEMWPLFSPGALSILLSFILCLFGPS